MSKVEDQKIEKMIKANKQKAQHDMDEKLVLATRMIKDLLAKGYKAKQISRVFDYQIPESIVPKNKDSKKAKSL